MHFINWIVPAFLCCPQSSGLGRGGETWSPACQPQLRGKSVLSELPFPQSRPQMMRKERGLGDQWALQGGHLTCHPDSPQGRLEVKKISGTFAGPHFSASQPETRPSAQEKKTMISGIYMVPFWRSPKDFMHIPLVIQSSQLQTQEVSCFSRGRSKSTEWRIDYSKSPLPKEVWNPEVMDSNLTHHWQLPIVSWQFSELA